MTCTIANTNKNLDFIRELCFPNSHGDEVKHLLQNATHLKVLIPVR